MVTHAFVLYVIKKWVGNYFFNLLITFYILNCLVLKWYSTILMRRKDLE